MRTHPDVTHYFPVATAGDADPSPADDDGATALAAIAPPHDDVSARGTRPASGLSAVSLATPAAVPVLEVPDDEAHDARPRHPPSDDALRAVGRRRPRKNPNPRYVPPGSRTGTTAGMTAGHSARSRSPSARHGHGRCGCRGRMCRGGRPHPLSLPHRYLAAPYDDTPPSDDVSPVRQEDPPPLPPPPPPPPVLMAEPSRVLVSLQLGTRDSQGDEQEAVAALEPPAETDDPATLALVVCNVDQLWPGAFIVTVEAAGAAARRAQEAPPQGRAPVTTGEPSVPPESVAVDTKTPSGVGASAHTPDIVSTRGAIGQPVNVGRAPRTARLPVMSASVGAGPVTPPPWRVVGDHDSRGSCAEGTVTRIGQPHEHPGGRVRFVAYDRPLLSQARAAARERERAAAVEVVQASVMNPAQDTVASVPAAGEVSGRKQGRAGVGDFSGAGTAHRPTGAPVPGELHQGAYRRRSGRPRPATPGMTAAIVRGGVTLHDGRDETASALAVCDAAGTAAGGGVGSDPHDWSGAGHDGTSACVSESAPVSEDGTLVDGGLVGMAADRQVVGDAGSESASAHEEMSASGGVLGR